tara:strand:+ start:172 stop:867 length:696 start_codon:yes stop_codon:yes gene_type:complete
MDTIEKKVEQSVNGGFVKHVFNFDNETKNSVMNIAQYILLAFLPCVLVNGFIENIAPEADEKKNNMEIIIEVLGQTMLVFVSILLIHRLVTYVPTYSGRAYDGLNLINLILVVMILGHQANTNIGKKSKILMKRIEEMWDGKEGNANKKQEQQNGQQQQQQGRPQQGNVSVGQPGLSPPPPPQNTRPVITPPPNKQETVQSSMSNMASNGMPQQSFEPVAANSMGGGFSSW